MAVQGAQVFPIGNMTAQMRIAALGKGDGQDLLDWSLSNRPMVMNRWMEIEIMVGISAGANVIGAIKLQQKMGLDKTVVTLLCDSNKKYLSTDLVKEEPVKDGYISTETTFTGYRPISRLAR